MILRLIALLCCVSPCVADVRLPKLLGSGMVLQRDTNVTVWGWADPGEAISVSGSWSGQLQETTAGSDGSWSVQVPTGSAGGPHTLVISGNNTISLSDILFGEVWVGSGQSNMEMPLMAVSGAYTGIQNADEEIDNAHYPGIRLFQAGNFSSREPLEDVESGIEMYGIPVAVCQWQACSPQTIPTFASAAYFFARTLHQELDVPVGIIDAAWGGTPAEAWTPAEGLEELGYKAELKQAAELPQNPEQKIPTRLYNGMIHPLRHFEIKGVVWYQGEGNASRADRYHQLFSRMISHWRRAFNSDFSFYYVQISPFTYKGINAAYLREAQLDTMSLPRTGMAVTMDIGNLTDIHPKNKQEVGRRLALWALAQDYGQQVTYSGPVYETAVRDGATMRVQFVHTGGGLATNDDQPPSHFELAGEDQVFHAATASIDGDEVIVSSPEVLDPTAVRFAFTSDAQPNLINVEGLPASSFRSDR